MNQLTNVIAENKIIKGFNISKYSPPKGCDVAVYDLFWLAFFISCQSSLQYQIKLFH